MGKNDLLKNVKSIHILRFFVLITCVSGLF